MFIFGFRRALLKDKHSPNVICPNCNQQGGIVYQIQSQHLHFYWIPFVPIRKIRMAYCAYCDAVFKFKRMTEQMQKECKDFDYYENVGRWKLWQFSGLILFLAMIIQMKIAWDYDDQEQIERQKNPQIGDLYKTKLEENHYTYYKIVKIDKDSIGFVKHLGHTTRRSKIYHLKEVENYSDTLIMHSKKDVEKKFETDFFMDIDKSD